MSQSMHAQCRLKEGAVSPSPLISARQRYEHAKLVKRLRRRVGQAIADFGMIEEGDRVMVCLSGGKDSYALLDVLLMLQTNAPVAFDIVAVHLDQKQPGFPTHLIREYLIKRKVPFHVVEQDTYSVVKRVIPEGKTMCSLCSRLRRGALYAFAKAHGIRKIALGHHRDDLVQTFFLNLFHHAKLAAMAPKLQTDDHQHIVIRPLIYVAEPDLVTYGRLRQFPVIPCHVCGSQQTLQRKQVGLMLQAWEKNSPGRIEQIARSLTNVHVAQLADRRLFDFAALGRLSDSPAEQMSAWLGLGLGLGLGLDGHSRAC